MMWYFLLLVILIVILCFRMSSMGKDCYKLVRQYIAFETGTADNNLFIKYGGLETIQAVVDSAVTNLLNEPSLAPVFSVVGQPNHRTGAQLKACLDLHFTYLLGGPVIYPSRTFTRGAIVDARTMRDSHKHLTITQDQFNTFVNVLVKTLTDAGVAQADINMLAPGLVDMAKDIVTVA